MTTGQFRSTALAFPNTEAAPHFDRTAFRVVKRRIFATLHEPSKSANIMLTPAGQSAFCTNMEGVYPVPNKWGLQGWTTFELETVPGDVVQAALEMALQAVLEQKEKK